MFFSLKPVPRKDYDALVDGADVGIAFYVASDESAFTQQNIQTIGLSSGKLAYYLRAGLPVVVNQASSIADVVTREACGVAVADAAQVGTALAQIAADYDRLSANAASLFDRDLDVAHSFEQVLVRLDALSFDRARQPDTVTVTA